MEIKSIKVFSFKRKTMLNIIMRTFILLFCSTVFSLSPNGIFSQNTKIKIEADKTISIDEVFKIIRLQTDFNFIYKSDIFSDYPKVSVKKGTIKANRLLEKSLSKGDFKFNISAYNTITIQKASEVQNIEISGVVTDENGLPIPGVSVYVSSRQPNQSTKISSDFVIRGTATDIDGNFKLKAEVGYYLVVSGLGYELFQTKVTASNTNYNIILKERLAELDEVVLVGYGSKTREQISSAISSVKGETVNQNLGPNVSFDNALSGLLKGVQINQNSGRPGANIDINIRGITSPFDGGDNQPLFVIDGVPFQTNLSPATLDDNDPINGAAPANPLLAINPSDIESIDVLKDAAATAIYGSRGANGVVIVKTKTGNRNRKTSVTFTANTTFARPINTFDWLNAQEFREFTDAYISSSVDAANAGQMSPFSLIGLSFADIDFDFSTFQLTYNGLNDDAFGDADTNWNDVVFRDPAVTHQYGLTFNGGNETTSYYLSLNHINQEGLLRNDELKQYNVRLGLETSLSKTFRTGANVNLSFSDNFSGLADSGTNIGALLGTRPDISPRDENGNFNFPSQTFFGFDAVGFNPLALTTENVNDAKSYSGIGNFFIEANLLKGLQIKLQTSGSINIADIQTFSSAIASNTFPRFSFSPAPTSAQSTGSNSKAVNSSVVTDLTASYDFNLSNDHNLDALLGFSWQRDVSDRDFFAFRGFPDDDVLITASSTANVNNSAASIVETGLNSTFGRVAYNYKNKYFLTGTLRRDRSSRFGPENQTAVFPSISASWNIAKENFINNSNVVNLLRLRASFGEVGSVNVRDFAFLQFFQTNGLYNGELSIGELPELANPGVKWERTTEYNIGLDFSLFKGRLRGSADVYDRETNDALLSSPFPLETGSSSFTSNLATVSNKGFEIEISGDIIKTNDFIWSAGFNISKNTNKLEEFNNSALGLFADEQFVLGREIGIQLGHVVEGIFQSQAEVDASPFQEFGTGAGDYKFRDLNGDNVIDDDDRDIIGSTQPDFFGGFNTSFTYKGLQLSALFSFSKGTESSIRVPLFYEPDPNFGVNVDRRLSHYNRWSPTNTDAPLARLVSGDPNRNDRISTASIFDSSFLRLNNVQLSYNIPNKVIDKLGLTNLTLTAAGYNLWTLTDFPGLDPAVRTLSTTFLGVRNSSPYPNSKSWSLGINVNF